MVHATILKLRKQNAELIEVNKTLLSNMETLKNENAALRGQMGTLQKEKDECKSKCEVIIHQKDEKIRELEEYKKSLKTTFEHLRDGDWSYAVKQEQDGRIAITHWVLPGARAKKP